MRRAVIDHNATPSSRRRVDGVEGDDSAVAETRRDYLIYALFITSNDCTAAANCVRSSPMRLSSCFRVVIAATCWASAESCAERRRYEPAAAPSDGHVDGVGATRSRDDAIAATTSQFLR